MKTASQVLQSKPKRIRNLLVSKMEKAEQLYKKSPHFNLLIVGDRGVGKSSSILTARTPIWVDSFDPDGYMLPNVRAMEEKGELVVCREFETDSFKSPETFEKWEKHFHELRTSRTLENFGTYALDSFTRFSEFALQAVLKRGGRAGQPAQFQDYNVQQLTCIDLLGMIISLPCDTIVTAHIGIQKDEVTGQLVTGLLLSDKFSQKVPLVYAEQYVQKFAKPGEDKTMFLTRHDGKYAAVTKRGGGILDKYEPAHIRALLGKLKLNTQNLPNIHDLVENLNQTEGE